MGYLNLGPKPVSFSVAGTEYIDALISWTVSDSSAFRNGIITTTGQAILGAANGITFGDYNRNDFVRGDRCELKIQFPSGRTKLHPRGTLYVISTGYSPEEEQLTVELGCELTMKQILERGEDLIGYASLPLDPAQRDFGNVAAAIATKGRLIWSDRNNSIQEAAFFSGDGAGSIASPLFASVRGVTALAVAPLDLTQPIPDTLKLSYQYPVDEIASDQQGRIDTEETTSNYFIEYPAVTFQRIKSPGGGGGRLPDIVLPPPVTIPPLVIPESGCGNSTKPPKPRTTDQSRPPRRPSGSSSFIGTGVPGGLGQAMTCNNGFETKEAATYVSATRTETRTSTYDGPAGQMGSTTTEVYGPGIEANSQYFADKFAFCVQNYGQSCNPMGNCPFEGIDPILLGKQTTEYEYGPANEVVRTTTSSWRPKISAAQTSDWRSGIKNGFPQEFQNDLSLTDLYLHQVVIREFTKESNTSVQKTTSYTSSVSRGTGLQGELDAYKGIKTTETRRSSSTVTTDVRPDSVNSATTNTETNEIEFIVNSEAGGYRNSFGPLVVKEDVPVPILLENGARGVANTYGDYLRRFISGDSRGLQIGEILSETIADSWIPHSPFRYYDPVNDQLMGMRMDATTWAVSNEGCLFVTSAIWINDLAGRAVIPENLIGNSTPAIDEEEPADTGGDFVPVFDDEGNLIGVEDEEIVIEDEQIINQRYSFKVEIEFRPSVRAFASSENAIRTPVPESTQILQGTTFVIWAKGQIVQPGALVSFDQYGSFPIDAFGNPTVDSTLIVDEDLFYTEESS